MTDDIPELNIRDAASCRWAVVTLGEVMLRLDPSDGRVATTREFRVGEGGGEYNVARGLKRCFGLDCAVVTALADNPVGRLIQDLIYQGGVDQSHLRFVPFDGVGRAVRNGLNFTERGFGCRAPVSCSDRGHTAASQMRPGDVDWRHIFEGQGARWFHTGGVFAALSESTVLVAKEAMGAAHAAGTVISYDLNYRESLWKSIGGMGRAGEVNRELVAIADVVIGNEEDYTAALGFPVVADAAEEYAELDFGAYEVMLGEVMAAYPRLHAAAVTLRRALSATRNDWSAICRVAGTCHRSRVMRDLEVYDRVGGGDSFASGFIYGLLTGSAPAKALELGVAHGALAMTTPGDTSMATLPEVERVASGGSVRIRR